MKIQTKMLKKTRQEYYRKLINQIVKHGSRDLENLIKDLFERNNFECIGKNKYDGQGEMLTVFCK